MPRVTIHINAPNQPGDRELLTIDLPPGLTIKDLKGFVEAETKFPPHAQQFFLNGQPITDDTRTLEAVGVKDGELLALAVRQEGSSQQGRGRAGQNSRGRATDSADDIETKRLRIAGDPAARAQLRDQVPDLLAAVDDPVRFREQYERMARQEQERERERQRFTQLLNEDPFNVEAQKKIEEIIREEQVINNIQHALDHNPEVFAKVTMLYINTEVNGHPVKAFVDSGAQATIMSPSCAEACGIMRLIDKRYAGVARGVGTAKILGRVHHAEIKVGGAIMPCAFTVMEGKDVDLLFGLDMLKRYKASIDLDKNALCFQGIEVPFLPESEIPKYMEDARLDEPVVGGPNGMEIGAQSGAVRPAGSSAQASASHSAEAAAQQASNQSHPSQNVPTPAQAGGQFPQSSIDQLQALGFSKEDAIRALQATDGSVEHAAGLLFEM